MKTYINEENRKGTLEAGKLADMVITLFDPRTVKDNATYAKGTLPSRGIPYVIANGIAVIKDSEPLKRR